MLALNIDKTCTNLNRGLNGQLALVVLPLVTLSYPRNYGSAHVVRIVCIRAV